MTRELAVQHRVDQSTILRPFEIIGKVLKVEKWMPYKQTVTNICQRLNTCVFLFLEFKKKDFLHKMLHKNQK